VKHASYKATHCADSGHRITVQRAQSTYSVLSNHNTEHAITTASCINHIHNPCPTCLKIPIIGNIS